MKKVHHHLVPSQLKAMLATRASNLGYWRSRFLTLWSQIEMVPSEPADAKVLWLKRERASVRSTLDNKGQRRRRT